MTRAAGGTGAKGRFNADRIATVPIFMLAGLVGTGTAYGQVWRFTPSIGVIETFTDNVALAPADRKQSDAITQVTPGLRVTGTTGRLKLNANYRMSALAYAKNADGNEIQNYLDAFATFEAVDNWLFVDARAFISQQSVSAFGVQPVGNNENLNANRAETATYQLSPFIRGKLGTTADYVLRYNLTTTNARGIDLGGVQVEDLIANVRSRVSPGRFGWAIDGTYQKVHREEASDVESKRLRGSLIYQYDPQIRATALVGWETNNYTIRNESSTQYGAELQWTPTERTLFSALKEKRTFGDSHNFVFRHRTRLTSLQLNDSKTATTVPEQLALERTGTLHDLLFARLAPQYPDPLIREQEIQKFLQQSGLSANVPTSTLFLTSRVILQRARSASFSILGVRNTVTVAASETDSSSLESGTSLFDDFSRASEVRQRGLTASWSHRLSGRSSFNVLASHMRSSAASTVDTDTTQSTGRVTFTHQLGPKTSGAIGGRYSRFDSSVVPGYREKAIFGSILVTF